MRLDKALVERGLLPTRSQAENFIKLGKVTVDRKVITKSGHMVRDTSDIRLTAEEQYVSRAGLKLASVAKLLGISFNTATVLDVGSSTGGFTDYALQHGAAKVYAVDVGTDQLHPSLRGNPKVEVYEQTDIRDVIAEHQVTKHSETASRRVSIGELAPSETRAAEVSEYSSPDVQLATIPDIIVIDVSFISLRDILPHLAARVAGESTKIVAMVKPQFEAGKHQTNKGIIKNDNVRREILKNFEFWAKDLFVIQDKRDSEVAGAKGNRERFYLLTLKRNSTTSPGRIT